MPSPTKYNKERGHELRAKTLDILIDIIDDKDNTKWGKDYRKQIILKLSGTILPRLNEVSGENGTPLQIKVIPYGGENNTTTSISDESNLQE